MKPRLVPFLSSGLAAIALAVASTIPLKAAEDNGAHMYYALASNSFSSFTGACTKPNMTFGQGDGLGDFFGMQAETSYFILSAGFQAGTYISGSKSYQGAVVDVYQDTPQNATETEYPEGSYSSGNTLSIGLTANTNSTAAVTFNGTLILSNVPDSAATFSSTTAGFHQTVGGSGPASYFPNFTQGSNCNSLAVAIAGVNYAWPAANPGQGGAGPDNTAFFIEYEAPSSESGAHSTESNATVTIYN